MQEIDRDLLEKIEEYALGFLKHGRKDFDEPHTKSVVHYVENISRSVGLNLKVMITAAWFHDIGYIGLFDESKSSRTMKNIRDNKELHMIRGAEMAKEFLERNDIRKLYTDEERKRVIHLVAFHDKLKELKDLDEIVLAEADTLGSLDDTRVKHTLDEESMRSWINGVRYKRVPLFKTELGKKHLNQFLPRYDKYI